MSSNIEFKRKVYRIPHNNKDLGEDNLLAFQLFGESNVRDADTGAISKSWRFLNYGWEYSLIKEVCSWAGDTEGGMLTLGGRSTKPENYLSLWRKAIKEAGTWDIFLKDFSIREGCIEYPKGKRTKGFGVRYMKEIQKDKAWKKSKYKVYGEERIVWVITLNTPKDLEKWLRVKGLTSYKRGVWAYLTLEE